MDRRSEIDIWRKTLAQNEREKLNHPTTVKRKFEAFTKIADKDANAAKKETKAEALVRENEALYARIKQLEGQLKDGEGGSLFDLAEDTPANIAAAIAGNVVYGRLVKIQAEIAKQIKKLKPPVQAG